MKPVVSNASQYTSYELREQIYAIPDTYIGSDAMSERTEWVLCDGPKIRPCNIDTPVGVERLFIEILSNAGDNVPRSRKHGVDPGKIDVIMTNTTITVANGGYPVPIDVHPKTGIMAPELIFGHLLTSSNYEGNREGAGRNGFGAKLTNIFSKEMIVLVGDSGHGRTFRKRWYNNMTALEPNQITEGYTGTNYVVISYTLDFARFNMKEYRPQDMALFARHCIDTANAWKIPVSFNGQVYNFKTPKPYAQLYFEDEIEKAISFQLYSEEVKMVKKGRIYVPDETFKDAKPIADVYLMDTPFQHHTISFINGMMTRDGGIHQDTIIRTVGTIVIDQLKNEFYGEKKAKKDKKGKPKKVDKPKGERFPIDIKDIKDNISIIANFYLPNPRFNSQSKTALTGWSVESKMVADTKINIKIPEDILEPIKNWKLINRLYMILQQKQEAKLSKSDGKKGRHRNIPGHDPANDQGTSNSHNCILMITEGQSAGSYGTVLRDVIPNGNDVLGILPIRGKLLNVKKASLNQIIKSNEKGIIGTIKGVMRFREGVDYSKDSEYKTLNYGHILVATDADVDGSHIRGLIYNYMFHFFPSLYMRPGFFIDLRLPVLRVYHGNSKPLRFMNTSQYNKFVKENPEAAKWKTKYFKGLGSSNSDQIAEDAADPNKFVMMVMDELGPQHIDLAFNEKMSEHRKIWINRYVEPEDIPILPTRYMSDFINYDLIQFSIYDISRSIPKLSDGFKIGQRKAFYGTYKTWKGKWENFTTKKVTIFATSIMEATNYHHGETSMQQTIISMVQDFVGANNLAYFINDGQFGSRYRGGKDAASPRYTSTGPNWWLKYIFPDEDLPILQYESDEGDQVEPVSFFPIIPMCLINGAIGIATGYSTFVPNHNPLDCSKWIKCRLRDQKTPKVYPWYRGFNGTLQIIDKEKKKKTIIKQTKIDESPTVSEVNTDAETDNEMEDGNADGEAPVETMSSLPSDEPEVPNNSDKSTELAYDRISCKGTISLMTKGKWEMVGKKIHVSELPIGKWTLAYKEWLGQLAEDKIIKDYRSIGNAHHPKFEIDGFENPSDKSLRLIKNYGMNNMVLLDMNNKPKWYHSAEEILEDFFVIRLTVYMKRKEYKLKDLLNDIKEKREKIRFYQVVLSRELLIEKRKTNDIYIDMDRLGINHKQYKDAKISNLSEEGLQELEDDLIKIQTAHDTLEKIHIRDIWISELEAFEEIYRKKDAKILADMEKSKEKEGETKTKK